MRSFYDDPMAFSERYKDYHKDYSKYVEYKDHKDYRDGKQVVIFVLNETCRLMGSGNLPRLKCLLFEYESVIRRKFLLRA